MIRNDAKILVVDDVAENRDLLLRRLGRLGFKHIDQAENGLEALTAIDAVSYDLVLLDIMMPELDGFGVLETLKADARIHDLPIVVISALSEMEPVVRCIELGAEDFIFKPFNPTLLRARVLATLEKKALRDHTREELNRKQRELDEARTLQLSLVPPAFHGADTSYPLDIDVVLQPAREVGGDLVDHFTVGDDLIVLALGDVSDKGAGAALMMARTHAMVRSLANRPDAATLFRSPEQAVGVVNAALAVGNANCMFVTFLMATLDLASGRLTYVRAGHIPPFLRGGDGQMSRLDTPGGPPLGLDGTVIYKADSVALSPGDSLLVVTDGFTEAQRPDGNLFGEARVEAFFAGVELGNPAVRPLQRLVDLARAHEAGEAASDDIAAVLMTLDRSWRPAHGA